jgi:hypothetical protein
MANTNYDSLRPLLESIPKREFRGIAEGVHVMPQDVVAVYVPMGGYSMVRIVMRGGHAIDIQSTVEPWKLALSIRKDLESVMNFKGEHS